MKDYSANFVLKNKTVKNKEVETSPVLMRVFSVYIRGGRFVLGIGETVNVKNFNPETMTAKRMKALAAFESAYNSFAKEALRDPKELKEKVIEKLYPARAAIEKDRIDKKIKAKNLNLSQFVRLAIQEKWKTKNYRKKLIEPTAGTIKNWKSLANNIDWFVRDNPAMSLQFADINQDWLEMFVDWMQNPHKIWHNEKERSSEGLGDGTTWKYLKDLKKFLRIAQIRHNYTVDPAYTDFSIDHGYHDEKEPLYLSIEELKAIKMLDLKNKPGLDLIRDWLLIACLCGQRVGDWPQLTPDNIVFGKISVTQGKTHKKVPIPIHPTVREIWAKYEGRMPYFGSEQHFNRQLKILCEMAGIDEIIKIDSRGNKTLKYEKMTSHVARRSFCTNSYINGDPIISIMTISGHSSESEFMRYIRMSDDDKIRQIEQSKTFTEAL